jgi:hypothetical protein
VASTDAVGAVEVDVVVMSTGGKAFTNTYVNPIKAATTTGRMYLPGFGSCLLTSVSIG